MTLTEFLLARIAEDESVARSAHDHDRWTVEVDGNDDSWVTQVDRTGQHWQIALANPAPAAHIARHDPARVLAECEVKRRIVDDATNMHTSGPDWDQACRYLALPYADHPDYREEWRP